MTNSSSELSNVFFNLDELETQKSPLVGTTACFIVQNYSTTKCPWMIDHQNGATLFEKNISSVGL